MARQGKAKIQWIADAAKRKATMRKRLPMLVKKAQELAILCDIQGCLLWHLPGQAQTDVLWPSLKEAKEILQRYNQRLESKKCKSKQQDTGLFQDMFNKANGKFLEVQWQKIDLKIKVVLSDLFVGDYRGFEDMSDHMSLVLKWRVEKHLMDINASLDKLRTGSAHALSPAQQQDGTVLTKTEVISMVNHITML
ncbi:MADS-box transcription factor 23-like [Triticum dicoccoides]|uniref:MADS-box transcription factor 23-like n=1 Tax=Triticum dicoccoides TaxID=85692 RepID=UPI00188EA919|nr:MADS-box transcription factor 23-like [Triticum dicoccoides]